MGRFKSIVAGPRKRKTITLPFPGARFDPIVGTWEGDTDTLDVRALRPDEYDKVVENAKAFAKTHGSDNPTDGDEHFERGRMLYTLLVSCLDKDSPIDAPVTYFESLEEIQTSEVLLPETQQYLFQHQRMWQEDISPLRMTMTEDEYLAGIIQAAKGDTDFFLSLRPGTQVSFMRSMANQLHNWKTLESQASSLSESRGTNASSES